MHKVVKSVKFWHVCELVAFDSVHDDVQVEKVAAVVTGESWVGVEDLHTRLCYDGYMALNVSCAYVTLLSNLYTSDSKKINTSTDIIEMTQ